jgi:hypothetical protein
MGLGDTIADEDAKNSREITRRIKNKYEEEEKMVQKKDGRNRRRNRLFVEDSVSCALQREMWCPLPGPRGKPILDTRLHAAICCPRIANSTI